MPTPPWSLEQATEIVIFDPQRENASGHYLYRHGSDAIDRFKPPHREPDRDGYAYGAFLLERFTTWDCATGVLDIHFLLSTSTPYQVQIMHTKLRLTSLLGSIDGLRAHKP